MNDDLLHAISHIGPIRTVGGRPVVAPTGAAALGELVKQCPSRGIMLSRFVPDAGFPKDAPDDLVGVDFVNFDRVEIYSRDRLCRVGAGVRLDRLEKGLHDAGLTFPPAEAHADMTVGEMIDRVHHVTMPRGVLSLKSLVLRLQFVDGTGRMLEIGRRTEKSSSGYNIVPLLCGNAGSLALVTEACLRVFAPGRRIPERYLWPVDFQAGIRSSSPAARVLSALKQELDPHGVFPPLSGA